jgi:hypothetical protein
MRTLRWMTEKKIFRLVQPGSVRGQVDQLRGRPGPGHPVD